MAKEIVIPVEQIHCEHCERRITDALTRLPGVLRVKPDRQTNIVHVTVQGAQPDEATLKQHLSAIGYEPTS